jgi:hypothetical protein
MPKWIFKSQTSRFLNKRRQSTLIFIFYAAFLMRRQALNVKLQESKSLFASFSSEKEEPLIAKIMR